LNDANKKLSRDSLLKEYNLLCALKKVAETAEGKLVLDYILKISEIDDHKFMNSQLMANKLGKQEVGRLVIDKLIQANVEIDCSVFSKKETNRMSVIQKELAELQNK
jgi:hypothetical protein